MLSPGVATLEPLLRRSMTAAPQGATWPARKSRALNVRGDPNVRSLASRARAAGDRGDDVGDEAADKGPERDPYIHQHGIPTKRERQSDDECKRCRQGSGDDCAREGSPAYPGHPVRRLRLPQQCPRP